MKGVKEIRLDGQLTDKIPVMPADSEHVVEVILGTTE